MNGRLHFSSIHRTLISLALSLIVAGPLWAQTPPPAEAQKADAPKAAAAEQKPEPKPGEPKPYDTVITKDAKTKVGVFKVHQVDDKTYWEIPNELLGRIFMWQTEVAELAQNAGYPGTATGAKVVRFERRANKIFLRIPSFSMRDETGGLSTGIALNSVEPIVQSFDVAAESPDKKAVVIEVGSYLLSDPADFSIKNAVGGAGADPGRSYVDSSKVFPTNVETRVLLTFAKGGGGGGFFFGGGPAGPDATSTTALAHHSLVLLPETPMQGRLKDSRIGYFTLGFDQFGRPGNRVQQVEYISRFRLEKKDPKAPVSDVVKPITFYLAREVPDKWRPYLKKGIESWQPAFEKAGFKKAIIALDAPTKEQDPNWDAEDARYSVIRWAPSRIANAMGPSIQDPRSGETISAHVIFWHNILDLVQKWYFVQCAAIDPRASKLPLPEPLTGDLIRYVVAHEVGHTLGLEHNFKASVAYSIKQLRDPKFVKNNGVSGSIMSYSRNNYVAQPGDGISYSTNGFIGPYDFFAIHYGYAPIPEAKTPYAEKATLDKWLSRQVNDPTVRFGNYKYSQDPTTTSENISNDPVEATRLGFLNLKRVANEKLFKATTTYGEDYDFLRSVYGEVVTHSILWTFHVLGEVGGVVETDYHAGRGGDVFAPVPKAQQQKAVRFLLTTAQKTPLEITSPNVLKKIEPDGYLANISGYQNMILRGLLSEGSVRRLFDWESLQGAKAYTVRELMDSITFGVWNNPTQGDFSRRSLQRQYLTTLDARLNGAPKTTTDLRLYIRADLKNLAKTLDKALKQKPSEVQALHLQESRKEIERILAGRPAPGSAGASQNSFMQFFRNAAKQDGDGCFADGTFVREMKRKYPDLFAGN